MTTLSKPVRRKVDGLLRQPLTVILYPHGVIGFQEYRARKIYTIPVMTAYRIAIESERREAKRQKEQARKAKQGLAG